MKNFIKSFRFIVFIICGIICTIQCIFLVLVPNYKYGEYTMVYKVYYPGNPKTYTITNELPMAMTSYKGTNSIKKTTKIPFFKKGYKTDIVFETSAPIEVVSYTFKEK